MFIILFVEKKNYNDIFCSSLFYVTELQEARALLGRLEFQRGNFGAALQVFQGIDIRGLNPKMVKAIVERNRQRKPCSKGEIVPQSLMSMHSVSLLLEAILLKVKSLEELGHCGGINIFCTPVGCHNHLYHNWGIVCALL